MYLHWQFLTASVANFYCSVMWVPSCMLFFFFLIWFKGLWRKTQKIKGIKVHCAATTISLCENESLNIKRNKIFSLIKFSGFPILRVFFVEVAMGHVGPSLYLVDEKFLINMLCRVNPFYSPFRKSLNLTSFIYKCVYNLFTPLNKCSMSCHVWLYHFGSKQPNKGNKTYNNLTRLKKAHNLGVDLFNKKLDMTT